jgi:hypothetical protein
MPTAPSMASTVEPSKPRRTTGSMRSTCLPPCWTIWSPPSPRVRCSSSSRSPRDRFARLYESPVSLSGVNP